MSHIQHLVEFSKSSLPFSVITSFLFKFFHHITATFTFFDNTAEKNFSITFNKASTKFCLSLHLNADISNLFVNGKEIFKFKADNKNVNFLTQFCLKFIFNGFSASASREVSLNRNVYDFSVNYNSIDKSDVFNDKE